MVLGMWRAVRARDPQRGTASGLQLQTWWTPSWGTARGKEIRWRPAALAAELPLCLGEGRWLGREWSASQMVPPPTSATAAGAGRPGSAGARERWVWSRWLQWPLGLQAAALAPPAPVPAPSYELRGRPCALHAASPRPGCVLGVCVRVVCVCAGVGGNKMWEAVAQALCEPHSTCTHTHLAVRCHSRGSSSRWGGRKPQRVHNRYVGVQLLLQRLQVVDQLRGAACGGGVGEGVGVRVRAPVLTVRCACEHDRTSRSRRTRAPTPGRCWAPAAHRMRKRVPRPTLLAAAHAAPLARGACLAPTSPSRCCWQPCTPLVADGGWVAAGPAAWTPLPTAAGSAAATRMTLSQVKSQRWGAKGFVQRMNRERFALYRKQQKKCLKHFDALRAPTLSRAGLPVRLTSI
eukprot:1143376-Pelagomonas_calceolata.AAC.1